jgi:hypothetical protein
MKKLFIYLSVFFASFAAKAQIVDAIGIAGGITYGTHEWYPSEFATQERYLLGFNVAGMVEFFHNPYYRWRVEVAYDQMGSKELTTVMNVNRTTYITLNNYLKIQYRLDFIMPYLLVGPRLEYLLINSPQIYGDVIGTFPKIWFTAAAGVGFELITNSLFRPFVEGLYNRDLIRSGHGEVTLPNYDPTTKITTYYLVPTNVYYHGFELRIGLRYVFDTKQKKPKCPKVINPMNN